MMLLMLNYAWSVMWIEVLWLLLLLRRQRRKSSLRALLMKNDVSKYSRMSTVNAN